MCIFLVIVEGTTLYKEVTANVRSCVVNGVRVFVVVDVAFNKNIMPKTYTVRRLLYFSCNVIRSATETFHRGIWLIDPDII